MTNVPFNHFLNEELRNEDFKQAFQTEKAILQKKIRKQKK